MFCTNTRSNKILTSNMEQVQFHTENKCNNRKYKVHLLVIIITEIIIFTIIENRSNLIPTEIHKNDSTLVFIHLLFRHGHRTVFHGQSYPNDPYINYTYEPYGIGELTFEGEQKMYNLGKFLRKYYYKFLGKYHRDIVLAASSSSSRCQKSLLLVLASLFPPSNYRRLARNLKWQPIPYIYNTIEMKQILRNSFNCPRHIRLVKEEGEKIVKNELGDDAQEKLRYLTYHSGQNISSLLDIFFLADRLSVQYELGLQLPKWTKSVFPHPLEFYAMQQLKTSSRSNELKTITGGFYLEDIIKTTLLKLNGTPKFLNRKLNLYSGHDHLIMSFIQTLGLKIKRRTPYGAFIAVEVHEIDEIYYLKVIYHDYQTELPRTLNLPECDDLCPFEKFIQLYGKYRATVDMCELENYKPEDDFSP